MSNNTNNDHNSKQPPRSASKISSEPTNSSKNITRSDNTTAIDSNAKTTMTLNNSKSSLPNDQQKQQQQQLLQSTKKVAFVHKLYAMLSDPKLSHLLWWTEDGEEGTFALNPCTEFSGALTKYFKHGNVSSFVRQLHMYGFHKVSDKSNSDKSGHSKNNSIHESNKKDSTKSSSNHLETASVWEFRHASGMFKKGDVTALSSIKRRQPASSTKNNSVLHSLHHDITTELPLRSQGLYSAPMNTMMQPQPPVYYQPQHSLPVANAQGQYNNQFYQPVPQGVQPPPPQQQPQPPQAYGSEHGTSSEALTLPSTGQQQQQQQQHQQMLMLTMKMTMITGTKTQILSKIP